MSCLLRDICLCFLTGLFYVVPLTTILKPHLIFQCSIIYPHLLSLYSLSEGFMIPVFPRSSVRSFFSLRDIIYVCSCKYLPGQITLNPELEPKLSQILHPSFPTHLTGSSCCTCLSLSCSAQCTASFNSSHPPFPSFSFLFFSQDY